MTPETAWDWLTDGGFFSPADSLSGLASVVKVPQLRDLNTFVLAIKTLGAWSVGDRKRVYVSMGREADQLAFRVIEQPNSKGSIKAKPCKSEESDTE